MPTPKTYDYLLAGGLFPNDAMDVASLSAEIAASAGLTVQLAGEVIVTLVSGVAYVRTAWKDDLEAQSPDQKPILEAVLSAHQGVSTQVVDQVEITNQPPTRADGVPYSIPKAASFGMEMCDRDFKVVCCTVDTKAAHTVASGADGTVTYVSALNGEHGDHHSIEVVAGATGVGEEDRALAVSRVLSAVLVTFGTDGAGASVVPSASSVVALINSDMDIALHQMQAVASGDGTGAVATVAETNLAGGSNPSCEDMYVDHLGSLREESWGEFNLVDVYKETGGASLESCVDQADADANGIMSAWDYTAVHPHTHDLLTYEIRDGYLAVDPTIPDAERWDHKAYAIGAPGIPGALGGSLRMFDGYLKPAPNGLIDAQSMQAVRMDPTIAPTASTLRLLIFHPAGSKKTHVMRLVTYRHPGTFA